MKRLFATALDTAWLMSLTSPVWISSAFWWFCHFRVIDGISRLPSSAATIATSSGLESHARSSWRQEAALPACCSFAALPSMRGCARERTIRRQTHPAAVAFT